VVRVGEPYCDGTLAFRGVILRVRFYPLPWLNLSAGDYLEDLDGETALPTSLVPTVFLLTLT
jgi:hypothetical protein